jgi:hypothetical protein
MRATFVVRGVMANGRFSDAYGSCDRGARSAQKHTCTHSRKHECSRAFSSLLSLSPLCVGEKRFQAPNRDVPATAETRASSRAIQSLLGICE